MNRLLFDAAECAGDRLVLRDARATHLRRVLKVAVGDTVRAGQIDGPLAEARVEGLDDAAIELSLAFGETPPLPDIDLLLALPRPKVLRRLLPQIAALGVRRILLCNASRVERPYFDTHVLDPAEVRAALLEGLAQAGDTRLPELRVERRLRPLVEDELAVDPDISTRWLLHPHATVGMHEAARRPGRLLLAIGPEGGWIPHELDFLAAQGFAPVGMGKRILRSDTACIAALALAHARPPSPET
jgi:16S rRNA (uracil1498-N3)-methyltransferase